MASSKPLVPLPFTIPVDSEGKSLSHRRRNDLADLRAKKSPRRIKLFAGRRREEEDDDRPKVTQHCPRQPSVILLVVCGVCREHMLDGSYALGRCTRCGSPHPLPPGLPQ